MQESEETPKSPPDAPIPGNANDIKNLTAAFEQLEATETGQPIARAIREHGTTIKFGATDEGAIAQFDPATNEITIHDSQKDEKPAVLAAHLAHEGIHVQWDKPDSIDQEYHAFKAEAKVWNTLKGDGTDAQCNWVSEMIDKGEDKAKDEIRLLYDELPEN